MISFLRGFVIGIAIGYTGAIAWRVLRDWIKIKIQCRKEEAFKRCVIRLRQAGKLLDPPEPHSWKALDSLRDALSNLESAIETLEHEQEDASWKKTPAPEPPS